MGVSLCHSHARIVGKHSHSNPKDPFPGVQTAAPIVAFRRENTAPISTLSNEENSDFRSSRCVRWVTLAATAAVGLSLAATAPAGMAAEVDASTNVISHLVPGDYSLSIAIPIPDQETWIFSTYGFLAPPPRSISGGGISIMQYQGGCPSWHPTQFERVVPDGLHSKSFPRQGTQWPALYTLEEATIEYGAMDSPDPSIKYASIIDVLLKMSDNGLTCFSL